MRAIEEIEKDIATAMGRVDQHALFQYADELKGDDSLKAKALRSNTVGVANIFIGNHTEALKHLEESLDWFEQLGSLRGMASCMGNIGNAHVELGDYAMALESSEKTLEIYQKVGMDAGVAIAIGNLGNIFTSTGDYPTALEHFRKARDMNEASGDRQGIAVNTGNIGNVYFITGELDTALEQYHESQRIYEELDNQIGVANCLGNIGNVLLDNGDYASAEEYYHRAIEIQAEHDDKAGVDVNTGNVVSLLLRTGRFDEAQVLMDKHEIVAVDDPDVACANLMNRATLMIHNQDLDGALGKLVESLMLAQKTGIRSRECGVRKALRDLAQKRNDFEGYIEHNNEFTRITEEINGKEASTKMAVQAKQREIDAERKEHEKQLAVLHSTLPKDIADRVARGETVNDQHENASVIFVDIVGFTSKSSEMDSNEVTKLLAEVFDRFDTICVENNITKIKTIGDSYMAVGFDAALDAAKAALDMQSSIFNWPDQSPLQYRIGIHCGPVTAGVIGTQRMQYDVWGDTVNVASRMESSGEVNKIHSSARFADIVGSSALETKDDMRIEMRERGTIDIKGKGLMNTFWLEGAEA